MNLKSLAKKITSYVVTVSLSVAISFSAAPASSVEAFSVSDAVGIGVAIFQGSAQMHQAKKEIDVMDNTEQGRRELYQYFRENCGVNTDPTLNARLTNIMTNLTAAVKAADPSDKSIIEKPYLYFVSADESFNAACSMGHVMMVNTGAFTYLSTDDEIAAIVGHEMGHGQKGHVAKGIKKKINKQVLAQVGVTAAGGGALVNVIGQIALTQSVAHGDRKFETEADNLAWDYILHTNYNIGACAAVMQRLSELYGEKSKSNLLNPSDHPDTGKRRDNYANKLYEYSGKHVSAKDGVIKINDKTFMKVAETNSMSSAERSFFVLGNLAKAFHEGKNKSDATVRGNTVYLGDQAIISTTTGDESAEVLRDRLEALK